MKLESDLVLHTTHLKTHQMRPKIQQCCQVAEDQTLLKNATNIWDVILTYSPGSEDIHWWNGTKFLRFTGLGLKSFPWGFLRLW